MSATKLISLLAERVAEGMRREQSVVDASRSSAWIDYQDEVVAGPTGAGHLFQSFIHQSLKFELSKLPPVLVCGLWWHTESGEETLFEASYAYENNEPIELAVHQPAESETFEAIASAVVARLNELAEKDYDLRADDEQGNPSDEEEETEA